MILRVKWQLWLLGTIGILFVLTSCSTKTQQVYASVAPARLTPGDTIPAPKGETILDVSGDVSNKNVGDSLAFDMDTLEQLGLVEYSIEDPWRRGQEVTYTGVLMSDLIEFAGVPDTATSIHMVALDDFEADISIADMKRWPVLLATRTNNEYMSIRESGPTRIIFPFDDYSEIDKITYMDLSIWNIESMEVQ